MNKITIIEGDIEFIGDGAVIRKVLNIFTIPIEDEDIIITNLENRGNDYILVEKFNGTILSVLN